MPTTYPKISGAEAIRRARNLKFVPDSYFTLIHLTCNMKTEECGQTVKHEHCRVRPALREDTFTLDGDLYFTFEDLDTGQPKMCFKRLMRFIAFPPYYELQKIEWFDGGD
ncbi:hypothetical protein EZS27_004105 [termite gut metagenome]|uniref:Uncharacterized protein n=1 Tax=termite gut metagenome TaxID=433724 RepID=A0A5J4STN1_9ZZZZ